MSMSELSSLRNYCQTLACRICILIIATVALAWYIARRLLKTKSATMTPPRKPTTHSDAGPSSPRSAIPNKPSYADALRSNTLLGTNLQFRLRTERLHASLQVPHFQFPRKPKPAVQKVFNTPELLAEILTCFPLESDRRLIGVCKAFWRCLNPGAQRHLYGIKQALGIKFSQSIASITKKESETIWNEKVPPELIHVRRVDWLFNVRLECPCAVGHHTPLLTIEPFTLISVAGQHPKSDLFNISLKLDAESLIKEPRVMHPELKGVKNVRNGQEVLYSNQHGVSRNWMDVKLLNMPFRVRVSVTVDFRKGMGAPTHHEGHCPVQGCQLGLWGQQVRLPSDM